MFYWSRRLSYDTWIQLNLVQSFNPLIPSNNFHHLQKKKKEKENFNNFRLPLEKATNQLVTLKTNFMKKRKFFEGYKFLNGRGRCISTCLEQQKKTKWKKRKQRRNRVTWVDRLFLVPIIDFNFAFVYKAIFREIFLKKKGFMRPAVKMLEVWYMLKDNPYKFV